MITYNGVTYELDEESGIAYFFNESRMAFCEECPIKTGKMEIGKGIELRRDTNKCPCTNFKQIASASISKESFDAIRGADAFDSFIEAVKLRDMPVGGATLDVGTQVGED